jgi:hypothetical protein
VVTGPSVALLRVLYQEDRRNGFGRYRAIIRFCSGLRSIVVGRILYR